MVLQGLAQWIHDYINTQDELGVVNSDVRVHKVFYSVCQALFYIVVFRHKDFICKKKGKFGLWLFCPPNLYNLCHFRSEVFRKTEYGKNSHQ